MNHQATLKSGSKLTQSVRLSKIHEEDKLFDACVALYGLRAQVGPEQWIDKTTSEIRLYEQVFKVFLDDSEATLKRRLPKSKKKRIRRKWSKRPENKKVLCFLSKSAGVMRMRDEDWSELLRFLPPRHGWVSPVGV